MDDYQRLKLAKKLFTAHLGSEGYHSIVDEDETYSVNKGVYHVQGNIVNKYGRHVGFFERTLRNDAGQLVIEHENLRIENAENKLGLGTAFNQHSVAEYRKHGVDHVEVYAGDEVGGYAWAREGFRLKADSRADTIANFGIYAHNHVNDAVNDGRLSVASGDKIRKEIKSLVAASERGEDVQPIHVATLGHETKWEAEDDWGGKYETWAGKSALLGSNWAGDYYFDYAPVRASSWIELACHDASCRPPTSGGTGGSAPLQARRGVVPGYGPTRRRDITLGSVRVTYKPDYPDDHPDPGEVVWAKVRFQEDTNQSKDRPVLIIGRINGSDKLAAVQLTSNDRPGKDRLSIGSGSWDRLGRQTSVKLDQIIVVDPKDYRREGSTFGRDKFEAVVGRLAAYHRTPVQIAASAWLEFYNKNHDTKDGRFTTGRGVDRTFPVITAAHARGDSRPVSHEEFQRLANVGRTQLEGFADRAKKIKLSDEEWSTIKREAYTEARQSWGGATIDMHTGKQLPQGVNAWAITVKNKKAKTISIDENATEAEFNAAMDHALKRFGYTLARDQHHLGVFHDDANHRIDFDPVLVVTRHADVETIGAASHSIGGAYNFADGNGYWPPHVDTSPTATNSRDDITRTLYAGGGHMTDIQTSFPGPGAWHSQAIELEGEEEVDESEESE